MACCTLLLLFFILLLHASSSQLLLILKNLVHLIFLLEGASSSPPTSFFFWGRCILVHSYNKHCQHPAHVLTSLIVPMPPGYILWQEPTSAGLVKMSQSWSPWETLAKDKCWGQITEMSKLRHVTWHFSISVDQNSNLLINTNCVVFFPFCFTFSLTSWCFLGSLTK